MLPASPLSPANTVHASFKAPVSGLVVSIPQFRASGVRRPAAETAVIHRVVSFTLTAS